MTLSDAVQNCLRKYAEFSGRACRSEYWYWNLFMVILQSVLVLGSSVFPDLIWVAGLASFGLFVPGLSVTIRRLHDLGKSGGSLLVLVIPLVGSFILLFWMCKRGTEGANDFGGDPNAAGA